ncbi:MAG: hypothetical protein HY301_19570, partial [Verrucomicrobia bacterium]|nr:hypothetical protein [Verrucomicrobiota bacterium]
MNALTAKITVSLVALFGLGVATGYVLGHRSGSVAISVPVSTPSPQPPFMAGNSNRPP